MKFNRSKWTKTSIGKVSIIDPTKKEVSNVSSETIVSFAEMADLNTGFSKFKFSQNKPIKDFKKTGLSYFRNSDVLLAKMTPCFENGKSGLVNSATNGIGFGSTEFFVLRGVKIEPYLLYTFISSENFIEKGKLMMIGTTGRKRLMKDFVSDYEIQLPPAEEQTQISSIFQSIETSIEKIEGQQRNMILLQIHLIDDLLKAEPKFGNKLNCNNTHSVCFGNIVDCIEQHDKKKNGVTRFIGLEDIKSDSFQLETWGNIEDGTTFTKRFNKGDILFGKRRPYLKKVALADFDGICSGDILVFRPKKEKILGELLPFYVSSEAFIQHAVRTSAGSLSPRTKWKDLKEFQFQIPDLETQSIILGVFSQIQQALFQLREQRANLRNLKQNLLNEILG